MSDEQDEPQRPDHATDDGDTEDTRADEAAPVDEAAVADEADEPGEPGEPEAVEAEAAGSDDPDALTDTDEPDDSRESDEEGESANSDEASEPTASDGEEESDRDVAASTSDEDAADGSEAGSVESTVESTGESAGGGSGEVARFVLVCLSIVLLLSLVGVTVLLARWMEDRSAAETRREATQAAEQAADAVLAYDYRHLDRDLKRADRHATGEFAKEHAKTAKRLRNKAPEVEAVVEADVRASSVVRASEDEVVCLLFVDQSTESTVRNQSVPDRNRVRMTMQRVDDQWKVSEMDAL